VKTLQVWAGVEGSFNRIGDSFIDQCDKSGHKGRISDIEIFASLGVEKISYPCSWEMVAPKDLDHCQWSYLDERLKEIQLRGQKIIAGLLNHGSGPFYTSLIDPDFPEKFSTYARLFAQRYPWVEDYTPIQEIMKTAKLSCLTGQWYPHLKDNTYFLKAVIHQCKATVLAMKEIRRINPQARLIQTEDLGHYQSTEVLWYQRDFENHRRWLAWDLMSGKVNKDHPLYAYLVESGIRNEEVSWFEHNTCTPDIMGLNLSLLSYRFLDHRPLPYPQQYHTGNGRHEYADVNALNTGEAKIISPQALFLEVWERYHKPLAVTECQARGQREDQMRWFYEIWQNANDLRSQGVLIEAVSAGSLLGAYDRHNLSEGDESIYEPGIFDLGLLDKRLVATGLSKLVQEIVTTGKSAVPILASPGVWHTSRRVMWAVQDRDFTRLYHNSDAKPLIITSGNGALAQAIGGECGARNILYRLMSAREMDISDYDSIEQAVSIYKPWAIINTTSDIQDRNLKGAVNLARICRDQKIQLLNFSSSIESADQILSLNEESIILKTAPSDMSISPSSVSDTANKCLNLLIDGEKGIIHLSNVGEVSWEQFVMMAAEEAKKSKNQMTFSRQENH
jgi:dTDP-4-dehydrorhamnose reductase